MEAAFSFKYQARFWLEVYFSSNQSGKNGSLEDEFGLPKGHFVLQGLFRKRVLDFVSWFYYTLLLANPFHLSCAFFSLACRPWKRAVIKPAVHMFFPWKEAVLTGAGRWYFPKQIHDSSKMIYKFSRSWGLFLLCKISWMLYFLGTSLVVPLYRINPFKFGGVFVSYNSLFQCSNR